MAACQGTLDVVVHFHSFRNVDLFSRGIYMVRVSSQTKMSKHVGIPYSYYSKPSTQSTFVRSQEIPAAHASTLPAAQIVNESSEFSTRAFVIKYRDERLELNEGVQFQLLVESRLTGEADDAQRRLVFENDEPITIKLDLLMAELEKPANEDLTPTPVSTVAAEKPAATPTFSRIATQTLCVVLDPASQQLHAYFPVTFSAMHFCQLDVTASARAEEVHTALINLKFRKRAYARADGALKQPVDASQPQSFHELLFPGRNAKRPVPPGVARAMSHAHLQPMLQSLGATAAALRNLCADTDALSDAAAGEAAQDADGSASSSSQAVQGVIALLRKPMLDDAEGGDADGARREGADELSELTPARVAAAIEKDIKLVARRLFLLWGRFVALLPQDQQRCAGREAGRGDGLFTHNSVVARLHKTWLAAQRRWWASRQVGHVVRVQKILQPADDAALGRAFRDVRARQDAHPAHRALHVYDEAMLRDPRLLPVCASHSFLRRDEIAGVEGRGATPGSAQIGGIPDLDPDDSYSGPHLIVMQHGWYASSFDMRLLRAYALLLFPRAIVLSPQSNEDNSGGSMGPMGARLAHEVHTFIKHRCDELCDPDPRVGRISFIGHSAGSMIVRTALSAPAFRPYLGKLHAFISLSSSHCGNMFVPSSLIAGGMWALQHIHQSTFMDELQLIDAKDMRESFMYKLSQEKCFEYFRYVVLVGSHQDNYVPMHTAQATIPRPAEDDKRVDGSAYMEMATNLMAPISQKTAQSAKQTTVIRLTMDYKFSQTNLDTVIGRAAHLAYIDSSTAVLLILFSLYNLLK